MIKALIFDFGRVISAWKSPELFHAYERDLGLAPGTINILMFESPAWQSALVGALDMDGFWQAVGPALNLPTAHEVEAFQTRYYGDERINVEMVELLRAYHRRLPLALLSNHPPGLDQWLRDWDIHDLFEVMICSGEVGIAKPDPRVFQLTLNKLGIRAQEAVFVDDTAGHVTAARELGLHGMLFTGAATLRRQLSELLDNDGDQLGNLEK